MSDEQNVKGDNSFFDSEYQLFTSGLAVLLFNDGFLSALKGGKWLDALLMVFSSCFCLMFFWAICVATGMMIEKSGLCQRFGRVKRFAPIIGALLTFAVLCSVRLDLWK